MPSTAELDCTDHQEPSCASAIEPQRRVLISATNAFLTIPQLLYPEAWLSALRKRQRA